MHKKLIIFLTAGFPDLKTTEELIYLLEKCGVDIIEIGVPFSDPIADGKSIQYSSYIALKNKITLNNIFALLKRIRRKTEIPIFIMSYLNPIYNFGFERFSKFCKLCNIEGIIIPDLTYDSAKIFKHLSKNELVYMVSSNTPFERIKEIFSESKKFVYVVSVLGVTGQRKKFQTDTYDFLKSLKNFRNVDKYLGFGISNVKQIKEVKNYVDGVIIGSAIVEILKNNDKKTAFEKIRSFVSECKKVL